MILLEGFCRKISVSYLSGKAKIRNVDFANLAQ